MTKMTDTNTMKIICVSRGEEQQISGGRFGDNETLVLNTDQYEIFSFVLSGVKGWAGLTSTKDAFVKLLDWMDDRVTHSDREGWGVEAAFTEVMKQFVECFWEATTDKDKKKFLMGIAADMERDFNDDLMDEWLSEIAQAKDRCQKSPEWSEDQKWTEFWEAIYVPAVLDDWFKI